MLCSATGQSVWHTHEIPELMAEANALQDHSEAGDDAEHAYAGDDGKEVAALPSGWEKVLLSDGRTYYENA